MVTDLHRMLLLAVRLRRGKPVHTPMISSAHFSAALIGVSPNRSKTSKEEMVRAQADAERAQRKQQRLNEAADAREQAVQEAGVLERGVAEQHPVQGDG